MAGELADVVLNALFLANAMPCTKAISLEGLLLKKIADDADEYPIDKYLDRCRYGRKRFERRKAKRPKLTSLPTERRGFEALQRRSVSFIHERRWEQFHTPASVALAILVKAGEIATCYQHRRDPLKQPDERRAWALADVLLNALRMSEMLLVPDLYGLVSGKLKHMATIRFAS